MLEKIQRLLFKDNRGIALALVMIIFLVSTILVTGILSAVTAQAKIIKSRENVSQAHYYAYSAVESVLAALENEDVVIKTVPVGNVNFSGLFPAGEFDSVNTYITLVDSSTNKYKITTTVEKKGQTAVSEAYINFTLQNNADSPSTWIEPKAPLAFIEALDITSKGLTINDDVNDFNKTFTDIHELNSTDNPYKLSEGSVLPDFTFKFIAPTTQTQLDAVITSSSKGFISYPSYNLIYDSKKPSIYRFNKNTNISNKFFNLSGTQTVEIDKGNNFNLINTFIYAPDATSISLDANNTTLTNTIIYAPNATITFPGNRFINIASGFIYSKNIIFEELAQNTSFKGVLYAKQSFEITNSNNIDISLTGAVITNELNLNYKTNKNNIPSTFSVLPIGESIDDYLLGFFKYDNPSAIIIGGGGGGSSVRYNMQKDSILYKK